MPDALEKTNRINLLYDYYGPLLTDKQQQVLKYYFQENYSLSEIADHMSISRQAVYEHIRRADDLLESFERKLGLVEARNYRTQYVDRIAEALHDLSGAGKKVVEEQLQQLRKWL